MSAQPQYLQVQPVDREAQHRVLREIADELRFHGDKDFSDLSEKDQRYYASLFLGTQRNWMDDLVPAEVPELYALVPALLMEDSRNGVSDDRLRELWNLIRRACVKQAAAGIEHELERD